MDKVVGQKNVLEGEVVFFEKVGIFTIRYKSSQGGSEHKNNSNLTSTFLIIVSLLLIAQPILLTLLLPF